jgi:carbamate kinase
MYNTTHSENRNRIGVLLSNDEGERIMNGTVVVLVNGEVLANGHGSTIADQRHNAQTLAEGLVPLLTSNLRVAVLHGNKPQVGFVLFRSELASHALHAIPLDVCGADTQGATGYMLSQALINVLHQQQQDRHVMCVLTQTRVDTGASNGSAPLKAIGPWFDRDKAEQYRQTRNWMMIEEPGRGYRRAVPSLPALEIVEIEGIRQLVEAGNIVIAGGGGGIPVARGEQGNLDGVEAVVETERVAILMAQQLQANVLLMVIDTDKKFILSGFSTERPSHLSLEAIDDILQQDTLSSSTVYRQLQAASEFLHQGGEQVIITTLRRLPETLSQRGGLRIGKLTPSLELFKVA